MELCILWIYEELQVHTLGYMYDCWNGITYNRMASGLLNLDVHMTVSKIPMT